MNTDPKVIKGMHPDEIFKMLEYHASELKKYQEAYDRQREVECFICEKLGYGYDGMPKGWGYFRESGQLFCDQCITRWEEKFGEKPDIYREGDEL